jgi:hypothetical protein
LLILHGVARKQHLRVAWPNKNMLAGRNFIDIQREFLAGDGSNFFGPPVSTLIAHM